MVQEKHENILDAIALDDAPAERIGFTMPRESKKDRQARAKSIGDALAKQYPDAGCTLDRENPLEMLVSTILSAQCTDKRVNIVTKDLFQTYRTVEDYANADVSALQDAIRTTGFFRNKSKNIIAAAQKIISDFASKVPSTMAELLTLPGVARKTANCVLGNAFGINEGIVVDTHVQRIAQRLKLTAHSTPVKIERDLIALFDQNGWAILSHRIIAHGRKLCRARKPDCQNCPITNLCPSAE